MDATVHYALSNKTWQWHADSDPDVEDEVLQDKEKGGYPCGGYHLTLVLQLWTSKVNKFVCEWRQVFGAKPMSDLDSERWNMLKYTLKMLFSWGFWTAKFFTF